MALIGLMITTLNILYSMKPGERALLSLQHIDISGLDNGSFLIKNNQNQGYNQEKYLVIRDHNAKLYVYVLPVNNNKVILPDVRWRWRRGPACSAFGPEMEGASIRKNGVIKCQDKNSGLSSFTEFHWTYDGNNSGRYTEDMIAQKHRVIENNIIINP